MSEIAELGIKINSDQIVKATKRLDKLENQSKQNVKVNKKLKNSFTGMGAAIGALGLGLAFKSIIGLAIEQERVVKQVDAAIKSTGGSAGFTTKELQKMAAGFQEVTTFGDEAILSAQSVLLTFTNLKDDVLPATTEAVLDLSARMGTDLQSSAIQLGKALNDPIANLSALSRAGIQFTVEQKEVIKGLWETGQQATAQKVILKELEVQFGGSARAARDTFGGAVKSLGNAFGDLLEGDDGNLYEAKGAIEELTNLLQDEGTKAAFTSIVTGIINITTALASGTVALAEFGEGIGKWLAGGDGIKSLEELNKEILNTENAIKSARGRLEISEGGGFLSIFNADPEKIKEDIRELVTDIELLQMAKDRLTNVSGSGTDTPEEESDKTGIAAALKQIELDKIAEIEGEAALDKAILEQEEMERLSDRNEEKLALEMDYYDRLYNLQAGSQQATLDFTQAIRNNDAKSAIKNGALMLSNLAKTNKAAFEVQKAFALANAIVTLPSAVIKSFDNGGGYPWGLIPAGLMLAQGLSQISAIQSTSFGSKTSSGGVSGGGTSPSAPVASGLPEGSTAVPSGDEKRARREVTITLEGAGYSKEGVRELLDQINEEIGDGAELVTT